MTGRIIATPDCVREGCDWLAAADPRLAAVYAATGLPPLRRRPAGFVALRDIIAGQQVSVASAAAIVARMDAAKVTSVAAVARQGADGLARLGLSRQKISSLLGIVDAEFDFAALGDLPNARARDALVALTGVGPWSGDIYLLTALGRADVFPAGDLALKDAARVALALAARPSDNQMAAIARAWAPWRAVAARLLWAYYRLVKQREGLG